MLGMSLQEVRDILGDKVSIFKRTSQCEMPSDHYEDLGIFVYYKKPGICDAIELCEPASPIFRGELLLGRPFSELREWFEKIDENVVIDGAGLLSYRFGVGLYAPGALKSPDDPVEGVIVFEKGYYDG